MNELYCIKCFQNLFIYSIFNLDTNKRRHFIISKERNDIDDILEHLSNVTNQIGFGNTSFDYYVLHVLINGRSYLKSSNYDVILNEIKNVGSMIRSERINDIPNFNKKYMAQLDLEKFFGFKSGDRNISLTDLKISLHIDNCIGLYKNDSLDYFISDVKLKDVIEECESDLKTIRELYYIAIGKRSNNKYEKVNLVSARYKLCEEVNLSAINYTPAYFAIKYFLEIYKRKGGTFGLPQVFVSEDNKKVNIPYYAMYKSPAFNNVVDKLFKYAKGELETFSDIQSYCGIPLKFGLGGMHGCASPGKYTSDDKNIIVDIDIASMYASIAVALNIIPHNMDTHFTSALKHIIDKRFSSLDKDDDISRGIVAITKNTLNYIYGKTREKDSQIYDPKYAINVVISSQLFMLKFIEELKNEIQQMELLMVNTDSLTIKIPVEEKGKIMIVFNKMRKIIPFLRVKMKTFNKLYIKDVNNYIANCNNDIIARGIFDYVYDVYKDNSEMIVPKAIKNFLFNDISVPMTVDLGNIYDFCIKVKSKRSLTFNYIHPERKTICCRSMQNPSRYFYSKTYKDSGGIFEEGVKITELNPVTILNNIYGTDYPPVDESYYINKIRRILDVVDKSPFNSLLF